MTDLFLALPVSVPVFIIAFVVTAVAATLQSTVGFGFAVASVPLLRLIDPHLAPVPQLLMIVPLAVSMAIRERASMDISGIRWVLLGRVLGALAGWALLAVATELVLDLSMAFIVIIAVIALAVAKSVPRNPATETLAGTVSGVGAMVSSIGGPPLALLYRDAGGKTLRSSLAAIFVIGLTITIATRTVGGLITSEDIVLAVCLLPAVAVGFYCSQFFLGRIEGAPLRLAILIVASLSAIGLVLKAILAH